MKKYKFTFNKKKGETRIEYYKLKEYNEFRFDTLNKILGDNYSLVFSIDTNLIKSDKDQQSQAKKFEAYFNENKIAYEVFPVPSTKERKIFGIIVKKSSEKAFNIVFPLKASDITMDFFESYLYNCDLLIGINPKKTFEELCKDIQKGYFTSFFDKEYFENTYYDSNYIKSIRITKIVEPF